MIMILCDELMIPTLLFLKAKFLQCIEVRTYYKWASRGRQSIEGLQCSLLLLNITEFKT